MGGASIMNEKQFGCYVMAVAAIMLLLIGIMILTGMA